MYCIDPEEEHQLEINELCETIVKLSNKISEQNHKLNDIQKVINQWTLENGRIYPFYYVVDELNSIIKHRRWSLNDIRKKTQKRAD